MQQWNWCCNFKHCYQGLHPSLLFCLNAIVHFMLTFLSELLRDSNQIIVEKSVVEKFLSVFANVQVLWKVKTRYENHEGTYLYKGICTQTSGGRFGGGTVTSTSTTSALIVLMQSPSLDRALLHLLYTHIHVLSRYQAK